MLSSLQLVERAEEATHAQEDDLDEPDLGRLVVIRRSGQDGGSCPVAPRLTFGRDPNECDIVIKLPDVSKVHARLVATVAGTTVEVWLHNLTKTNPQGTLVNGAPVEINGKRLLQSGDVIAINERKFRFESPPPPVALAKPRAPTPKRTPSGSPKRRAASENAGTQRAAATPLGRAGSSPSLRSALRARRAAVDSSPDEPTSAPRGAPTAASPSRSRRPSPSPRCCCAPAAPIEQPAAVTAQPAAEKAQPAAEKAQPAAAAPVALPVGLLEELASRRPASAASTPDVGTAAAAPSPAADKLSPAGPWPRVARPAASPRIARPSPGSSKLAVPGKSPAPFPAATPAPQAAAPSVDDVIEEIFSAAKPTPVRSARAESTRASLCAMIRGRPSSGRKSPHAAKAPKPATPEPAAAPAPAAAALAPAAAALAPAAAEPAPAAAEPAPAAAEPAPAAAEPERAAAEPERAAEVPEPDIDPGLDAAVGPAPMDEEPTTAAPAPAAPEPASAPGPAAVPLPVAASEPRKKKPRSSLAGLGSGARKGRGLRVSFGSAVERAHFSAASPARLLPSSGRVVLSPADLLMTPAPHEETAHEETAGALVLPVPVTGEPLPLVEPPSQPASQPASAGQPSAEPRRRSVKFQRTSEDSLRISSTELDSGSGPHSERKRKPVRASWEQTPGARAGERRSSKTPAAAASTASKRRPTPATNAPLTSASDADRPSCTPAPSSGLGAALRARFTPSAASMVNGLLEGQFTPLYTLSSPDSTAGISPGTMHAFGLFAVGEFAVGEGGATPAPSAAASPMEVPPFSPPVVSPQPPGGRVNTHLRFLTPVADGADVWAGVMRYEVVTHPPGSAKAAEATPVSMSLWGPWEEVQQWEGEYEGEEEYGEEEYGEEGWPLQEVALDDEVYFISPGVSLRRQGAHLRFPKSPASARDPSSTKSPASEASRQSTPQPAGAAEETQPAEGQEEEQEEAAPPVEAMDEAGAAAPAEAMGDAEMTQPEEEAPELVSVFGVCGVLSSTRGPVHVAGKGAEEEGEGEAEEEEEEEEEEGEAPGTCTSVRSMIVHPELSPDGEPLDCGSEEEAGDEGAEEGLPVCRLSFTPSGAASAPPQPMTPAVEEDAPAPEAAGVGASVLLPTRASLGSSRRASQRYKAKQVSSERTASDEELGARSSLSRPLRPTDTLQSAYSIVLPSPGSARIGSSIAAWPPSAGEEEREEREEGSEEEADSEEEEGNEAASDEEALQEPPQEPPQEDGKEAQRETAPVDAPDPAAVVWEEGAAAAAAESEDAPRSSGGRRTSCASMDGLLSPELSLELQEMLEPGSVSREMLLPSSQAQDPTVRDDEFGSARRTRSARKLAAPASTALPADADEPLKPDAEAECSPDSVAPAVSGADKLASPERSGKGLAADTRSLLEALRVAELRERLDAIGLPSAGRKAELVERLLEALPGDAAVPAAAAVSEAALAAAPPSGEHERAMLAGLKVAELRSLLECAGLAVATKITKAELLRQVEAAAAVGSLSLEADADATAAPPMSQSRPKRARAAVEETPAPVSASVRKGKRAKAMADEEPPSSARRSTRARR